MNPKVFLVGFMGCGKTSVGRLLAERLGLPFTDLDARIEEDAGLTVADIFQRRGESGFRQAESRLLESVARGPAAVLALGGGAFSDARNRRLVQSEGLSVWLDVPLETAWARCAADPRRPLAADRAVFTTLHRRRRADYALADLRVDTDGKTPAQIAAEIQRWLKSRKGADHGLDSNH